MLITRRTIEIEWGDCDPADIVYFPNYFAWFDASLTHHFEKAGLPKKALVGRYDLVGFPVVDARARFHKPSTYGDEVTIETRIAKFGRSSFEVEQQLLRGGELAVEGFQTRVLVGRDPADPKRLKSVPVPAEVIALFEKSSG